MRGGRSWPIAACLGRRGRGAVAQGVPPFLASRSPAAEGHRHPLRADRRGGRDGDAAMIAFHPLADIFPLVEGQDFAELVDDIREHGLHEPIVVYEDKILDGRNRYRACEAAGKEPTFTVYTGDDPVAYVVSLNLRRRHLDESQRAMVAAKLAKLRLGDNQHSEGSSIEGASRLLNVGHASVERAKTVQRAGTPELIHAVEQDAVSVSAAADVAMLPQQDQR